MLKSVAGFFQGIAGSFTTLSSSGLYTPTGGIKGVSTNTNATAGNVGEYIFSNVAGNAVSLSTGVNSNLTSISLTAGDWDVSGVVIYNPAAATSVTLWTQGTSNVSATNGTAGAYTQIYVGAFVPGAIGQAMATSTYRWSLASTTTIYLVASSNFSISTMTAGGYIGARRVQPGA